MTRVLAALAGLALAVALPACNAGPPASGPAGQASQASAPSTAATLPLVVVHKSETCGCCNGWVEHMRAAGFPVEVRNTVNLGSVKEQVGIPVGKGSCHTAEVDGYFVEGHVPAADVKQLLATRPEARGLVLPGMPVGSPGMEAPDGRTVPYTVELVEADGTTRPFAHH